MFDEIIIAGALGFEIIAFEACQIGPATEKIAGFLPAEITQIFIKTQILFLQILDARDLFVLVEPIHDTKGFFDYEGSYFAA
jgi:hypothetical protein